MIDLDDTGSVPMIDRQCSSSSSEQNESIMEATRGQHVDRKMKRFFTQMLEFEVE